MQKKKKTVLIKSSIFVTKRPVGAIWCLNVTVLFTFAKPYLNFVYHGICRSCPVILVLKGVFLFVFRCRFPHGLYCIVRWHLLTKALSTKKKYKQISIYKMLGIHSRNICFVFVRGKKKIPMNTNSAPKPPLDVLVSLGYKILHLSTASSYGPVDCKSSIGAVNFAPKTKA